MIVHVIIKWIISLRVTIRFNMDRSSTLKFQLTSLAMYFPYWSKLRKYGTQATPEPGAYEARCKVSAVELCTYAIA